MMDIVNSSQGGNSAISNLASSMADRSLLMMAAMVSSGRRTTSGARNCLSGMERETGTGMVDGAGRYSVRYLSIREERERFCKF